MNEFEDDDFEDDDDYEVTEYEVRGAWCPECGGTGIEWDGPEECPYCLGEGYIWW